DRLDLLVDGAEQLLVPGGRLDPHRRERRGSLRSTIARSSPRFSTTAKRLKCSTTTSPALRSSCPRATKNRAGCARTASYSASVSAIRSKQLLTPHSQMY